MDLDHSVTNVVFDVFRRKRGGMNMLERYQPFRVLWGYRQHVVIGGHGMEHCEPLAL